ncbi:MAG: YaaR family protein [Treponema sp.]|nr:YaaR family protein [Treponema sp.]
MDRVDFSSVDFQAASLLNAPLHPGLKQETKKAKPGGEPGAVRKFLFAKMLEDSSPAGELGPLRELAPSEEALTELMDEVHSAGSDLKDRPFAEEILRYKKAVRNFVHYVVENTYTVKELQTRRRELKNLKPHVQIQVIDRKLEELAAAILSGQTTQLERVSKIDEITGLLVDLTISGSIRKSDD